MITLLNHIVVDVPTTDALPENYAADRDGPHIVVEGDGTPVSSQVHTGQAVRVIVHALTRPDAVRIIDVIDALLQLHSSTGVGIAIRPGQNPLVDKDSGGHGTHYIASAGFTVLAPRTKEKI